MRDGGDLDYLCTSGDLKKKKVDSVRIYLWVNSEGCGYELGIEIEEGERQLRGNLRI